MRRMWSSDGPRRGARPWRVPGAALALLLGLGLAAPAAGQSWPDVFEPTLLLTLNLQMTPADWNTVQNDGSFSIWVPANFWADGETPIIVSVRRKSATELIDPNTPFDKVSVKIDINMIVPGQSWHGVRKLSLENGDDQDIAAEGLAWAIHRAASGTQGYGYPAGLANWVRLFINSVDTGVYVNPEQRDLRFLENRGLYSTGQTWLYKVSDTSVQVLKVGSPDSPTVGALCYAPFDLSPSCSPMPDLATHLPQHVDMAGILTLMAGNAFTGNSDAMLSAAKNFYWADFAAPTDRRMYLPWDLDSVISGPSQTQSIYAGSSAYAPLLSVPAFRAQYNQIYNDLICGPWSEASLHGFLNAVEPVVVTFMEADVFNRFGEPAADRFDGLRTWVTNRVSHVLGEIEGFQPCPTVQVDLNEFMASNTTGLADPQEPGEFPDWIELRNPGTSAIDIGGLYLTDDPNQPTKHQIPGPFVIPGEGYALFYADNDPEDGDDHLSFKLNGTLGEAVAVFDVDGVSEIDSETFGPQFPDTSWGRFPDGAGPFGFMANSTPGAPNVAPNPPPSVSGTAHFPDEPGTEPVLVLSLVSDNSAVAGVTLHYDAGGGDVLLTMFDDGAHGDGAASDDQWGATIPAFANDTVVQYYVEAMDDLGATATEPAKATLTPFVYVVGYTPPQLFVNEFMADNGTAVADPNAPAEFPDWIEIYNAGVSTADLSGMFLTDDVDLPRQFEIPSGITIPASGFLVFWADSNPLAGDFHTNFRLNTGGEEVGLYDSDARGNLPIDFFAYGSQLVNTSQGRCPDGGPSQQLMTSYTPGATNVCSGATEACCLPGDTCEDHDLAVCTGAGGIPQGSSSTCPASCPACIIDSDCNDGIACTIDTCSAGTCAHAPFDLACDNGIFCDGAETCDVALGCQAGVGFGGDTDGDTVCDDDDNCPDFSNLGQVDVDSDGIGDACTCGDATGDGIVNVFDVQANQNAVLGLTTPEVDLDDCSGDGIVNVLDIQCTQNRLLGLITQCTMICARMPTVRTGVPACP